MADNFRLTPEEQSALRGNGATIRTLREHIAKLKAAGFPVDEQEEMLNRLMGQNEGLLREFGAPLQPRS